MRQLIKRRRRRVKIVTENSSSNLEIDLQMIIIKLENQNCEIIDIAYGAGVGECESTLTRVYSALISYYEGESDD